LIPESQDGYYLNSRMTEKVLQLMGQEADYEKIKKELDEE
jgi:hypothetical protein